MASNQTHYQTVHVMPPEGAPPAQPSFLTRLLGGMVFGASVALGIGAAGYIGAANITGRSLSGEQVQHDLKAGWDNTVGGVITVLRQTPVIQNMVPREDQP